MQFNFDCLYPKGALWITYDAFNKLIELKRCLWHKPYEKIKIDEYQKIDDIIQYSIDHDYSNVKDIISEGEKIKCHQDCVIPKSIKNVSVSISHACNINCYHCYFAGHHYDTPEMKKAYFDTLYKIKGHQLDKILLTDNGEPFVYYDEILEYIQSLSQNDTKCIEITTNLTLLNEERIDKLYDAITNAGIDYRFIVSLDGITKETFEATRIGANWEQVTDNLKKLGSRFGYKKVVISYVIRKPAIKDAPFAKSYFWQVFGLKTDIYYDYFDEECKKCFLNLEHKVYPYSEGILNIIFTDSNTIYYSKCCKLQRNKISYDSFSRLKSFKELKFSNEIDKSTYYPCDYYCDRCLKADVNSVVISCVTSCNLHCYNCIKKDDDFVNIQSLKDGKVLFSLLNTLKNKNLEMITLDGNGEVFIFYNKLVNYLKGLNTNNFKQISFITNGTLLNEKRIMQLSQISEQTGIQYYFNVSLDGCTKETYELSRPGSNFEKVVENIKTLLKYFKVEITYTIKKTNLKDALVFKDFAKKTFDSDNFLQVVTLYDILDKDIQQMHNEGKI